MSILVIFNNYPLFLIIVGTILNFLTLLTISQSTFRDTKKYATIHYLRVITIFDILMLYGWNLNHYLSAVHGWTPLTQSIRSCRFDLFFGYTTCQTSAWLRVFVSIDRCVLISSTHPKLINKSKTIIIIIVCVILFFSLFNFHFLPFGCSYTSDGTVDINSYLYKTFPLWDYINLGLYNGIPFFLMLIFNSYTIYKLIHFQQTRLVLNLPDRSRAISIPLLTTTFLFLIMTIPTSVSFAFFYETADSTVLNMMDGLCYTYHILSFPLYFITFKKFRRVFIQMIKCKGFKQTIAPQQIP